MSDWFDGELADSIAALDAGVSVNAEGRPHGAGEIGVLKTSAVFGGRFLPDQNKTVVESERRLVAEPVQGDSILVSRMNTPALVGESCYVREGHPSLFLPDRLWQLKPKDRAKINMRWLSFALQSDAYRRYVEVHATGTSGSMKNLPKSKLMAFPIRYPAPPEQAGIALVLDTLDIAVHETEAIIAKLTAVKQGLVHDLLTRGVAANGELRPPQAEAPHFYKLSPLGWIPKEWDLSTVGEQFEIQLGKMLDGQKNTGVLKPYLGNKAVQWDRVDLGEVQQVRLSKSDLIRFRLQKGDLLVCEGGDVGRAAIWDNNLDECYYQKALHRLRPLRGYHPRLMLETLRYLMGRDALSEYISRTSIAHLTQEKLAAVPLPTPKVDEQGRMAAEISTAKQRLETEESQLQKLRLLKSGLMNDLLTGCVRVTPLLAEAKQPQGIA